MRSFEGRIDSLDTSAVVQWSSEPAGPAFPPKLDANCV